MLHRIREYFFSHSLTSQASTDLPPVQRSTDTHFTNTTLTTPPEAKESTASEFLSGVLCIVFGLVHKFIDLLKGLFGNSPSESNARNTLDSIERQLDQASLRQHPMVRIFSHGTMAHEQSLNYLKVREKAGSLAHVISVKFQDQKHQQAGFTALIKERIEKMEPGQTTLDISFAPGIAWAGTISQIKNQFPNYRFAQMAGNREVLHIEKIR
ncbi:MAG TPA: hypothetical protein VLG76_03535 [Rhabdochlamydiaceae bacterium]|nr:hypothetical protein [Rhabdochlamydiaceae bacterium]